MGDGCCQMMAQTLSVLLVTVSITTLPILATILSLTAVTNDRHAGSLQGNSVHFLTYIHVVQEEARVCGMSQAQWYR